MLNLKLKFFFENFIFQFDISQVWSGNTNNNYNDDEMYFTFNIIQKYSYKIFYYARGLAMKIKSRFAWTCRKIIWGFLRFSTRKQMYTRYSSDCSVCIAVGIDWFGRTCTRTWRSMRICLSVFFFTHTPPTRLLSPVDWLYVSREILRILCRATKSGTHYTIRFFFNPESSLCTFLQRYDV